MGYEDGYQAITPDKLKKRGSEVTDFLNCWISWDFKSLIQPKRKIVFSNLQAMCTGNVVMEM